MTNDVVQQSDAEEDGGVRTVATAAQRRLRLDVLLAQLRGESSLSAPYLLPLAEEALDLAIQFGDSEAIAICQRQLGICAVVSGAYDQALMHLRQALRICQGLGEKSQGAEILLAMGSIHIRLNDHHAAMAAYHESLAMCEGESERGGRAAALAALGNVLGDVGEYVAALEHQLEALAIRETLDDPESVGVICNDIGLLYSQMGDSTSALGFFNRSLEIFRECGSPYLEILVLGNLGALHLTLGHHASALDAAMRTLVIHQQLGDRVGQAGALIAVATCQERSGHLREAVAGFQRALELAEGSDQAQLQVVALVGLGNCRRELGEHWRAIADLERALAGARQVGERRLEYLTHEAFSKTYEAMGDSGSALEHYKVFVRMRDELQGREKRRAVTEMEIRFALARAERERDQYRAKVDQLQAEVEQKVRELNALTLNMMQKDELLDMLKEQLARSSDGSADARLLVQTVIDGIEATREDREQRKGGEENLFDLHRDFIRVLTDRYPELTTTETKVCVLLKLSMATKDIANLLYLSERTVENHRYRIRRKMGLPADTNLILHLASI